MTMSNPGAYPHDPTTQVGALRTLVGDTASTPLSPPVAGQASYAVWSDADLQAALTLAESPYRAAGDLYTSLAAQYAQTGRSIKTDDLGLDSTKRSGNILDIAKTFYARADEVAAAEGSDFFEVVQPEFDLIDSPWADEIPGYAPPGTASTFAPDPDNPGYLMP